MDFLMFALGAAVAGGSFVLGLKFGLALQERHDDIPKVEKVEKLPRRPHKGGSAILEYADPSQAEY